MSDLDEITEQHRRLRAIVYVRQSSPGQVQNNHESLEASYPRLRGLLWGAT
jgi:hypothetical protein